jgi:HlyD family secretion protein
MNQMTRDSLAFAAMLLFLLPVSCKEKAAAPEAPVPRPVSVTTLREIDPVKPLQLTGSVKSWKEQDLAFEVDGRLKQIVEIGANFMGIVVKGAEQSTGIEEVARLDEETFRIQVEIEESTLEVARLQVETAKVELAQVLPANLKAAEASMTRAEAEWERNRNAVKKNAISEVEFIRSTADLNSRKAEYEKAKADLETKKAEIKMHEAGVKEAEGRLERARYNLGRCVLKAPFPGEISEVYVETGGYARQGQAVAHLVMMDPIKVDLAVSAETASRLNPSDDVLLYLPGTHEPFKGMIYEKATVADPETRTFRISILTRNPRTIGLPPGDPLRQYPRISFCADLNRIRLDDENTAPFAVEADRSLRRDERGYYVWVASDWNTPAGGESGPRLCTLKRYDVTPGDREVNFLGLYTMRELVEIGDLEGGMKVALDVPDHVQDGDQVLMASEQWVLHPGQLIPVLLGGAAPKPGLYVPMNAIKPVDEERGEVFVAVDGRARKVEVKLLDKVGELYRVEAAGLLEAGARVILDYIHFLQEGEPVQVIKMKELKP